MNEEIGQLFVVDWSFMLILVGLAAITVALFVRRARTKRRARREERRKRRREYQAWLRNSGVQPLNPADEQDHSVR
jgi:flagellar biosynthesis/type III secretory pathway M-ring protein FliF/YscJ